jgi:hypothetical protein
MRSETLEFENQVIVAGREKGCVSVIISNQNTSFYVKKKPDPGCRHRFGRILFRKAVFWDYAMVVPSLYAKSQRFE